jgi:Mn2+/Fe2+ NRAMP family transporter
MSIIQRFECKQEISDSALFCPKCGAVKKNIFFEKTERMYQLLSIGFGLSFAILFLASKAPNLDKSDVLTYSTASYMFGVFAIISLIIGWMLSGYELKAKNKNG